MSLSHTEVERQFLGVASALGAKPGEEEYHRGLLRNAPFLLKLMSHTPPEYMVKVRMTEPRNLPSDWHDKLPEEYASAKIRCELDGDYLYLWIDDAGQLTEDAIAALVLSCVEAHSQYFPRSEGYCFGCRRTGSVILVQSSSSVATWCERCLVQKHEELHAESQRLNAFNAPLAVFLPLGLFASAVGWAVFWSVYDWVFRNANADHAWVPEIIVMLVVLAVGFGLGWPVGWLLHRSGAAQRLSPVALSVCMAALIVLLGELMHAGYVVFAATGTLDPGTILQVTPPLALGGNAVYTAYKLVFGLILGCVIYEVAKPEELRLRV